MQPPDCPHCGEPLVSYSIHTSHATANTSMVFNYEAGGYIQDYIEIDDSGNAYTCDACGSEIEKPEVEKYMRVFLICPVRNATPEETDQIAAYVADLEAEGVEVYWPARDTDQIDPVGLRICQDNIRAINDAHAVHVWYSASSTGGLFDLGAAMALHKPIRLANKDAVQKTDGKSFVNVLLLIDRMGGSYLTCDCS